MKSIGLWVERPDKPKHKVETIACHEDHLGNAVAEGRLDADEYWPKLVASYRADLKRTTAEKIAVQESFSSLKQSLFSALLEAGALK